MNRAEIAEKYKAVIERRLSKFRNDEAQEFYTKTLPNRLEQFRANYTGAPEEMEVAVEEEEEERVLDFWDYLDDETAEEKEKAISEYAENDADYQPLASEIIADQQKEVEELKLKLHKTEELRDLYYTQKAVAIMQLDIINFISRIYSEETLTFIYGFVKSAYKHQIEEEQEIENDGEM